jgi:hypothetical protein
MMTDISRFIWRKLRSCRKSPSRTPPVALTLQHGEEDEPWQEFFISARELNAGRAMNEIPLMMRVAANTVDAFIASHPRKRR